MAIAYVSRGTLWAGVGNTNQAPTYPDSIAAGNLLIMCSSHINNTTQRNATYDDDGTWTDFNRALGSSTEIISWYKIAAGTESGTTTTITVGSGTSAAPCKAWITRWTGADATTPLYAGNTSGGTASSIPDAGVTVTAAGDVAVNIVAVSSATATIEDFTGESGGPGDWTKRDEEESERPHDGMWTALFSGAGTIDGGTFNCGTSNAYVVQGFAIKAASAAVAGLPVMKHMGGVEFCRPFGSAGMKIW